MYKQFCFLFEGWCSLSRNTTPCLLTLPPCMLQLILLNSKNIFQIAENVLKTYFSREIFCSTTLRI